MLLFVFLTGLEGYAPKGWYPAVYAAKVAAVTVALLVALPSWRQEIRPDARVLLPAIGVGLITFAEWVGLDRFLPYPHLTLFGTRMAYDPFASIADPALRSLFLVTRFYGLAVMVPIMEEVFWRSFLLRFATDPGRWSTLPIGQFSAFAFFLVAAMFGASHPEWLVAVICAMLYAGLLRWTRSLFACIVAHGVTNLALGVYVLATGDWKYW
jgi:CAAX prenyl protease-like protein